MIKKLKYQLILISVTFSGTIFALNEILENEKVLTVHKTPTCGCCKMWMKHAEEDGFTVYGQDHQNLMKIKEKYNIEALSLDEKRELQQILLKKDKMSVEEASLLKNLSSK